MTRAAGEKRKSAGQQSQTEQESGLADYIDQHRDDLEQLADQDYPVSRIVQALLDRRDRGEI